MKQATLNQTDQAPHSWGAFQIFQVTDQVPSILDSTDEAETALGAAQALREQLLSDFNDDPAANSLPTAHATVLTDDGHFVDIETGETVAMLVADDAEGSNKRLDAAFTIDSRPKLEWYMRKRFDAEAEIGYIQNRIAALTANLEAMKGERQRKLDSLNRRFEPQAQEFVKQELAAPKSGKTYRTPWGSVASRTVGASLLVETVELAFATLSEDVAPSACSLTPKVLPSQLPKDFAAKLIAGVEDPAQYGLKVRPAYESFTFRTGIEDRNGRQSEVQA